MLYVAPGCRLVCRAQPRDAKVPVRLVVGNPELDLLRSALLLLLHLLLLLWLLMKNLLNLRRRRRSNDNLLTGLELPRGAAGRGHQRGAGGGGGDRPDADGEGLAGESHDGTGLQGWALDLDNLKWSKAFYSVICSCCDCGCC